MKRVGIKPTIKTAATVKAVASMIKTKIHGRLRERNGMADDATQECERCKCKVMDRIGRCIDCNHENDTAGCSCDDCIMCEIEDEEDEDLESE